MHRILRAPYASAAVLSLLLSVAASHAAPPLRSGVMVGSADPIDSKDFTIGEAYIEYLYAPFHESSGGWKMDFRWHASAGALGDDSDTAGLVSAGFQVGACSPGGLTRFHIGTRPTVLSKYDFDERDLGGKFQFISHAGLSLRLTERLHVGARAQHLSNASFYDSNPGLDTVVFDVGWTF